MTKRYIASGAEVLGNDDNDDTIYATMLKEEGIIRT
jgi:hypothetical protein